MRLSTRIYGVVLVLGAFFSGSAFADPYADTIAMFKENVSDQFFEDSYGFAVFPTIGKGGMGIGGARGSGRVYRNGVHVGDTTMTQVTVGFQLGGQAFSQIIFFEDARAFDEFTSENFEFGAQATAVAITAGASATAGTTGAGAAASGNSGTTGKARGDYFKGMAIFTFAKGGLMYEATIGGQKFSYRAKSQE